MPLDAYARVRTPKEAARGVGTGPRTPVPLLPEGARGAGGGRYGERVHATRVAGRTT